MKKILTFILLLNFSLVMAQSNSVIKGEKVYPCSELVYFGQGFGIKFRIAKDGNKGIIIFEDWARIAGTVYLYLEDNTIIKLIDRSKFDYYNDTYFTQFNLTESEVNTLKKKDISSIRIQKKIYRDGSIGDPEVHNETEINPLYTEEKRKEAIEKITHTTEYFVELFK